MHSGQRITISTAVHPSDCNAVAQQRAFYDALAYAESNGIANPYSYALANSDAFPDCNCVTDPDPEC